MLVIIVLVLAGFSAAPADTKGPSGPIKIGVPASLTGAYAVQGMGVKEGITAAVDEVNEQGGILGRRVELIIGDTALNPQVALTLAKRMVFDDKVDFLVGVVSSGVGKALSPFVKEQKVPLILTGALTSSVLQEGHRYIFGARADSYMMAKATQRQLKGKDWKKIWYVGADYEMGYMVAKDFKAQLAIENPDIKVIGESYAPQNAADYSPYIQKILLSKPDVIFPSIGGSALINFIRQGKQYGMLDKISLFGIPVWGETMQAAGPDFLPEGILVLSQDACFSPDTPEMNKWAQKYAAKYGHLPTYQILNNHNALYFLKAAIEKAGKADREAVVDALEGLTIKGVQGVPITMRAYDHQPSCGIWLGSIKKLPQYNYQVVDGDAKYIPGDQLWMPIEEVKALRKSKGLQ
jgi:branched-chain amino acid transport system substrate-binding protein